MAGSGIMLALALPVCVSLAPAVGHAQTLTTLYTFTGGLDGGFPSTPLLYHDGLFYGATANFGGSDVGVVFALDAASGSEKVIYTFSGADGAYPDGALVYHSGKLYGTTDEGGQLKGTRLGYGTVYEVDPTRLTETVVYRFGSGAGDGENPEGGLIYNSGILYGTTSRGGLSGRGTLFAVDPATQTETILHAFARKVGGALPEGTLLYNGGLLYGTASQGGEKNAGTIYTFDLTAGTEATLYNFPKTGAGGVEPSSGVIYQGGNIYGVTVLGGKSNAGTVYRLNPATGVETVLYNFAGGADGTAPVAALVYDHGTLYGTTQIGGGTGCGGSGCGTVFAVNAQTGAETVLHSFTGGADGGSPTAALILHAGIFYGTTQIGGAGTQCGGVSCGTIFSLVP